MKLLAIKDIQEEEDRRVFETLDAITNSDVIILHQ
jgi:hypothetical protein